MVLINQRHGLPPIEHFQSFKVLRIVQIQVPSLCESSLTVSSILFLTSESFLLASSTS